MPRSPAKSLTSTVASPRTLRSLPAISGQTTKETVIPRVLTSDQAVFPDYWLPDHTGTVRTLSELQGRDPLILLLARGNYCPKHRRLDGALEAGMRIVSLFRGDPAGYVEQVHDALSEALRDRSGPAMLRAAVVSTMTPRRFGS